MNDEIKIRHELNILSNTILDDTTYKPTISRRKLLLDYITNLQQENERLKEQLESVINENQRLLKQWFELEEYIENESSKYVPTDPYIDGTNATYEEVLDKMKEIKDGNNVSDRD